MGILTVEEIIEATGGTLLSENSASFNGVSIDSRTIKEGDIFFALKGDRCDGHHYLENALMKGSGAIVETRPGALPENKVIICVSDTLRSLQDLAHFLRMRRNIPVVAVTGSNGKTTTKEMIHLILSERFKTLKNEGNLNNHIGLPLSLTQLAPDHEMIVLEMGMNAAGEIRRLCEIAVPSHGVITNIGPAHVGMLGSYDAVRAAKLEILDGLSVAVVNGDDDFLMQGVEGIKDFNGHIMKFAVNTPAPVMAKDVRTTKKGSEFILEIRDNGSETVNLNVHGLFNVYNALAASAVCYSLGMNTGEIRAGLETYRAFPMRFEVAGIKGITIINDSYNANPASMKESVNELIRMSGGRRSVAVLGDMRELGEFSEDEHRAVGKMIEEGGVDIFIAVGTRMRLAAEECMKGKGGRTVYSFTDVHDARKHIMSILETGDTVLIKGSRSMSMESLMEEIADAV